MSDYPGDGWEHLPNIRLVDEPVVLRGRRVTLRPLAVADFGQWQEIRTRNHGWLVPWEPQRPVGAPDVVESRAAFAARCRARDRERQLGTGSGFGIFVGGRLVGEINLNGLQRGPFQTAQIGYWVDETCAGQGIVPEAFVVLCRHGFEDLVLHRIEVAIIPRNKPSRRVMEKLRIREEGIAVRYLEIDGRWEDHIRYGITAEEWEERSEELVRDWL